MVRVHRPVLRGVPGADIAKAARALGCDEVVPRRRRVGVQRQR
ncbi:MAG: hypothetical protein R2697_06930 [Ilumatobacteraceae bacterium]